MWVNSDGQYMPLRFPRSWLRLGSQTFPSMDTAAFLSLPQVLTFYSLSAELSASHFGQNKPQHKAGLFTVSHPWMPSTAVTSLLAQVGKGHSTWIPKILKTKDTDSLSSLSPDFLNCVLGKTLKSTPCHIAPSVTTFGNYSTLYSSLEVHNAY